MPLKRCWDHRYIDTTRIYLRLPSEDVKREVGKNQF